MPSYTIKTLGGVNKRLAVEGLRYKTFELATCYIMLNFGDNVDKEVLEQKKDCLSEFGDVTIETGCCSV